MSVLSRRGLMLLITVIGLVAISSANDVLSQLGTFTARDPGVRVGGAGAGGMLPNLSTSDGTSLTAPALVATSSCGLVAGLLPPIAGCAWQPAQLSKLNRGPRPASVSGIVP
jgi:hypothetical protein